MHILVTGATGKVGSRIVPRVLQRGDAVRVLVRQAEQGEPFLVQGAEVAIGDLRRLETLAPAVQGIDAVLHLAAFFRGATPDQARETNLTGALNLAQASVAAGMSRFVFFSTNLVYGSGLGHPAREDDIIQPAGSYPESKAEAEHGLDRLCREQGLGLSILRLAFVYGDGDPHLAEFAPRLRSWPPAKRLHLVHHADVAQAALRVLDGDRINGRIYNVADDDPVSAAELSQLTGQPMGEDAVSAPFDPWEGIVDTTRIKTELGFSPLFPSLRAAQSAGAASS
jgi:nucleoside-diphosphate-sugar epimerase